MSVSDQARSILELAGALKTGHFILSSGLHSDRYCQCATLFERAELAERCARLMLQVMPGGFKVDVVLSPALGGVLFARPELLMLDEPTNYLDLEGTLTIYEAIDAAIAGEVVLRPEWARGL